MAKNDVTIRDAGGHSCVPTWRFQTEAGATAILAGEPTKWKSNGSPYVIPLADADGAIATVVAMVGVAASAGTHTASADGKIDLYMPLPGVVYSAGAKSSTAANTQAKIDLLCGDRVVWDLTNSKYTVDTAAGDVITSPIVIIGGEPALNTLHFVIRLGATYLGDQDLA